MSQPAKPEIDFPGGEEPTELKMDDVVVGGGHQLSGKTLIDLLDVR